MKVPVTIDLSVWSPGRGPAEALDMLRQAVATIRKPRRWRVSEYAMVKADARRALDALESQAADEAPALTLDLFAWTLLQGELGRLWRSPGAAGDQIYALYAAIRSALLHDERAARLLTETEEHDKLQRRIVRTRERLAKLERRARESGKRNRPPT